MLRDRLGLSERRACKIADQHRSTQRHQPTAAPDDAALREISKDKPGWGHRRARACLIEQGSHVNKKRVQRLWREEGLRVPQRKRKGRRVGESAADAKRLSAAQPNDVWAPGLPVRRDRRRAPAAPVQRRRRVHARGAGMRCERSITDQTGATLERLAAERDAVPERIRMDNGPEFTAHALRDWCRLGRTANAYVEPGSPWQNPYVESFNARVRDEVLNVELFDILAEANDVVAEWCATYNAEHPHSALGMLTAARFAATWTDLRCC